MPDKYILVKQKPVPCYDLMEWGLYMQKGKRHIGDETKRGVRVSTVFLGLDHRCGGYAPVLFESMIFGDRFDGYQCRYFTMNQAREGHRRLVKFVRRITKCKKQNKSDKRIVIQTHLNRTTATCVTPVRSDPPCL